MELRIKIGKKAIVTTLILAVILAAYNVLYFVIPYNRDLSMPYISSVRISRKLPDTLCVAVEENGALCAIETASGHWLMSSTGKLVEQTEAGEDATVITGLTPMDPAVGQMLQVPEEETMAKDALLQLLPALESREALKRCGSIDLQSTGDIVLRFDAAHHRPVQPAAV